MTSKESNAAHPLAKGHDAPITSPTEDLLGASKIANAIHRAILNAPTSWSTRIGLYGAWGSGKTSILNLLEQIEIDDGSIVVRSSAWSAVGEAGILHLLYSELTKQFLRKNIKVPKIGVAKNVALKAKGSGKIARLFGRGAEVAGQLPAGTSDVIFGVGESAFAWLSINKHDIDALISQLNGRRVIVFVDDLDRADPRLIPKTLLALRELLDWPGFSFVLAFDRPMVARALTEYSAAYGENAQTFLEKVVDVAFEIGPPTEAQKFELARQAFYACCPFFPESALAEAKQYLPNEPRRVKLIARKIGLLKNAGQRHNPDEIDWFGLLMHQIIHESSPGAASFVVDAATDDQSSWSMWFGDKAEIKDKETKFRVEIANRMVANNSPTDERVILAALVLVNHWGLQSSEVIHSLLNLVFNEPAFTRKEFATVFAQWVEFKNPSVLFNAVEHGARIADVSIESSAQDFFALAIAQYAEVLSRMEESEFDISWQTLAIDAEVKLSFLEYLWSQSAAELIQDASKSEMASSNLIAVVTNRIGWDKSSAEKPLREREKVLALKAVIQCNAPDQPYENTDPYLNRGNAFGTAGKSEWIEAIRATLTQPVCERLFARFKLPGELFKIVRDEEGLAIWLLESAKSPLYSSESVAEQIVNALQVDATTDPNSTAVIGPNAKTYLYLLLGQARNARWGGVEKISEIHARYPKILKAAWDAVASCRVPFRMASSILKLRKELVEAGIPADQLAVPVWLMFFKAELDRNATVNSKGTED